MLQVQRKGAWKRNRRLVQMKKCVLVEKPLIPKRGVSEETSRKECGES